MDNNAKIRNEIWEEVCGLTDEQLNIVIEENSWSIAQVLEHLYLMEIYAAQGIKETLKNNEINPTNNKPIHLTTLRNEKREAPEHLVPTDQFLTLEELKEKLTNSRKAIEEIVKGISETVMDQRAFIHPRYGLLSIKQWIIVIGYHEQRHLEQIREIKEKLLN